MASISPTTTPRRSGAMGVTLATSTPALIRRSAACSAVRSTSPSSRTQPYGIFTSGELPQEAQVVVEKQTDVVDAVLEDRDPVDAHAEGPAGDLFRVVAAVAQHLGMDHARAQDLQPPRLLAHPTPRAAAQEAQHVHLRRGLGEGKERGPEADL